MLIESWLRSEAYPLVVNDEVCFHCGERFGVVDRFWIWYGAGVQIFMHQPCLLDWLPRVQKDADRIEQPVGV